METISISKELFVKINKYCIKNPIKIYWNYNDVLEKEQIIELLEPDGYDKFSEELYAYNLDYFFTIQNEFMKNNVYTKFKEGLTKEFNKIYPNENDEFIETEIKDFLVENADEFDLVFDTNLDELLKMTKNINCLIVVYSNYDCTNSFDTMKNSEYLRQVYQRVKTGVKKDDFMWEHDNGAYGGSLFCFVFNTSLIDLIDIKKEMQNGKKVLIPKGTQFGFFSSFSGSGSCFEKTTYRNMELNIAENDEGYFPEYDRIDIIADMEQNYSMNSVYGGFRTDEQNIQIK